LWSGIPGLLSKSCNRLLSLPEQLQSNKQQDGE
jgi:hypothetical protein